MQSKDYYRRPGDSSYTKPGSYTTKLDPVREGQFQQWVKTNKVPWKDDPKADYDMRGYFLDHVIGGKGQGTAVSKFDDKQHFPDTYKTPYHATFSEESKYALPGAPHWEEDRLIDRHGNVVADETPQQSLKEQFKGTVDKILNIRRDSALDVTEGEKQLALARRTPNPLDLPDFRTREASIESKLIAIANDPEYATLSDENKVLLRNMIYEQMVVPTFEQAGLAPPERGMWLRRTIDVSHLDPSEQFYQTINIGPGQIKTSNNWLRNGVRMGENFFQAAGEIEQAGVKMAHSEWNKLYTKAYDYAYPSERGLGPEYKGAWGDGFNKYVQDSFNWAEGNFQRSNDIDAYWTDTHPANSVTSKLLGAGGYLAGQMPFYHALGAAVGTSVGLAGDTAMAAKIPGAARLVTNLTEALTATKKGQFVARTLNGAAQGYLVATMRGENSKGQLSEMGQWAAQEALFPVIGGAVWKGISWPARKFLGTVAALGGHTLMQGMFDAAMADAFNAHTGVEIHPSDGVPVPKVGIDEQFNWTPSRPKDFKGGVVLDHTHSPLDSVKVTPHGAIKESGTITYKGEQYPYNTHVEMQTIFDRLATASEAERAKNDPILHRTNEAMGNVLKSLSDVMFGHRDISRLSHEQLGELHGRFGDVLNRSLDEAPIHAPEVVEAEQTEKIQEYNKKNPLSAKWDAKLTKNGDSPAKAVTKNIVEQAKKRSGVKNADKDIQKVGAVSKGNKAAREAGSKKAKAKAKTEDIAYTLGGEAEYEPTEGTEVGFGLEEALGPEGLANLKKSKLDSLVNLHEAKKAGKAYLMNPENKGYVPQERYASDGSVIGKRDKRSWQQRMGDINSKAFADSLPLGSGLDFESDAHKILFHWGNRRIGEEEGESTRGITRKMAYELRKEYETPDRKLTYKDFDRASDLLGRHLIQLAKSNNLQADGSMKVFNSSNFFDQPTIWQAELDTDVHRVEMQMLEHLLQHYPEQLEMMGKVLDGFQNKQAETYDVNEWLRYNGMIDTLMTGELTPEMKVEMKAMGLD